MTTHTPGPWKPTFNAHNLPIGITSESGLHVTDIHSYGADPETNKANAHLIAAAPDLLAACEHALETFGGVRPEAYAAASRKEFDILTAAIKKSKGEA